MAMEFVGDYNKKKKVAEALRKQQEALSGLDLGPANTVTGASGAFPGMVQANWGTALAKLGQGYLGSRAIRKGEEADIDTEDARMAALRAITSPTQTEQYGAGGMGPPTMEETPPEVTPEKIAALQSMGFDPSAMGFKMPEPAAYGAVSQSLNSVPGIKYAVLKGEITPEQGDDMIAKLEADEAKAIQDEKDMALYKESIEYHAPVQGRAESEAEFAIRDPAGYAKFIAAKNAGKPPVQNTYEKERDKKQAAADVLKVAGIPKYELSRETIKGYVKAAATNSYDGTKWRAMDDAAKVAGLPLPSNYNSEVQKQEQDARQFHLDAMKQMLGFGQITEAEQKILSDTQFDRYDTAEARKKKVETIERHLESMYQDALKSRERMAKGVAVLPAGGDEWSIEP